jgi:tripartite-type tricarboxylate transporter receptor subunit TctC
MERSSALYCASSSQARNGCQSQAEHFLLSNAPACGKWRWMSSIAAANAVVQAGKVRPLAVTSATRFPGLPDLPALNETLPGVVVDGWFGVVAPTGTPPDIVVRVNREIGEFLKNRDIQQRLISFGLATNGAGTPESTGVLIRDMQAHWRALARELDIQPQ